MYTFTFVDPHVKVNFNFYLKLTFASSRGSVFTLLLTADVRCGPSSAIVTAPSVLPNTWTSYRVMYPTDTYVLSAFVSSMGSCPIIYTSICSIAGGATSQYESNLSGNYVS
jgi:hypothetical protein